MSRSMVGLLAAVGTAMSALVSFAHGGLVWVMIIDAATATGLAAYLASPGSVGIKKNLFQRYRCFSSMISMCLKR
jgi:hypothetical protein